MEQGSAMWFVIFHKNNKTFRAQPLLTKPLLVGYSLA